MNTLPETLDENASYSILTKAECLFSAIWHNPKGAIATEKVAEYYGVSPDAISELLQTHWEEFDEEITSGWTPRAAIRLGMLLTSPTATNVRSLALDVIEAHKIPSKRASVEFLLKSASFVEWSDREIGRIIGCDHKVVGGVRKKLESEGKVIPIDRRRCNRGGKTIEQQRHKQRENEDSSLHLGTNSPDAAQNPDSYVERENEDSSLHLGTNSPDAAQNPDSYVAKVRVSSQSHIRYGQEGTITGQANMTHVFVAFADCPSELVAIADLDSSSVPYPQPARTYTEEELAKCIEEALIGRKVEIEELAVRQVREQLQASRNLVQQMKAENVKLQQEIQQLEALKLLEEENQHLQQRNAELEKLVAEKPMEWSNPIPEAAAKVLNQQVKQALKNTIDLRQLAVEPPKDAVLCLQLMGLALGNLAQAINNTQALEAAAILLGCEANKTAIAQRIMAEKAIEDIRAILSTKCSWEKFWTVAQKYQEVKELYWPKLTNSEKDFIRTIKRNHETQFPSIEKKAEGSSSTSSLTGQRAEGRNLERDSAQSQIGGFLRSELCKTDPHQINATESEDSIPSASCLLPSAFLVELNKKVASSDIYSELYVKEGVVVEEISSDEVMVLWNHDKEKRPRRYFKNELRLI
ncbi:hypothetical protein [Nostoc linckia]|uniref:hypothetical protein n=1 Tax=Nostoc linckia TaxID=92942 RepID=UPI000BFF8759|nr:hypothetical protein [Nostoc linckia]